MATERQPVRVIDLRPEHESLYFVCLEDWPGADVAEAGDHKARWYQRMRDRGLRVKLALDAEGRVGGMIQAVPIELSPAVGRGLEFILCIWVHGHAQGRGNFQGHGMGAALLEAAEADARARSERDGGLGPGAADLDARVLVPAPRVQASGSKGLAPLVWKPFSADAERQPGRPSRESDPTPCPGRCSSRDA
jgi:GNAT superfamily N-acetyltransferase